MVGVPLSIGIGVFVVVFRRRGRSPDNATDRGA